MSRFHGGKVNRYTGKQPATLAANKIKVPDGGEQLYPDDLPDKTENKNRVSVDDVLRKKSRIPRHKFNISRFLGVPLTLNKV